ncbi:S-adenosyl-L-methionine-dependent methyltransferase [Hymenopellis radicata]|nr:S-adenosyl-L-methionine-dependent methyltransferase [Hymenopellis radicata]
MSSDILQLSSIISNFTQKLVDLSLARHLDVPSLDINSKAACGAKPIGSDPHGAVMAMTIASAAYQLYTLMMPPREILFQMGCAHSKSAALETCIRLNVTEHLREAGPAGLDVSELGKRCKVDGTKLARCIRSLSNVHIFKEVSPNVFTNNMISAELDTGKSTADIKAIPLEKHDGTNGFPALAELLTSIACRSSPFIFETLTNAETAFSDLPVHAPITRAFNMPCNMGMYQWLHRPEEEYRRRMFGAAMTGIQMMERDDVFEYFDWSQLPTHADVVDVGGGIGSLAKELTRSHPHLRIIVQDLPKVIEDAEKLWAAHSPEAVKSGKVVLQPHDFFQPQPVRTASVFILKHIVHNWSFARNKITLCHLAEAATPTTRLLVATNIVTLTCHNPTLEGTGAGYQEAPAPLLPNYGAANEVSFDLDMCMMNLQNTQGYTIHELADLLGACGWRIEKVYNRNRPGNFIDLVQAVLKPSPM